MRINRGAQRFRPMPTHGPPALHERRDKCLPTRDGDPRPDVGLVASFDLTAVQPSARFRLHREARPAVDRRRGLLTDWRCRGDGYDGRGRQRHVCGAGCVALAVADDGIRGLCRALAVLVSHTLESALKWAVAAATDADAVE